MSRMSEEKIEGFDPKPASPVVADGVRHVAGDFVFSGAGSLIDPVRLSAITEGIARDAEGYKEYSKAITAGIDAGRITVADLVGFAQCSVQQAINEAPTIHARRS